MMIATETVQASDAIVPRKRKAAKATTGKVEVKKFKLTAYITHEAEDRLVVHARYMRMDKSELIEHLIQEHLRRFVVSDRAKPSGQSTEVVSES